ncbi:MAG: DEAD/DEAH box helicase [Bacteroidaceae bacterium]
MIEKVSNLIRERIEKVDFIWDFLVLKGFPIVVYDKLAEVYRCVEEASFFKDGKLDLEALDGEKIRKNLQTEKKQSVPSIMLYESYISLINNSSLPEDKTFLILTNNVSSYYPVDVVQEIPDFDWIENLSIDKSDFFSSYYMYCKEIDGRRCVQYADLHSPETENVHILDWITSVPFEMTTGDMCEENILEIYRGSDQFSRYKQQTVLTGESEIEIFVVDPVYWSDSLHQKSLSVLNGFLISLGYHPSFFLKPISILAECRPDIKKLLKEIYGYDSFRNLSVYKNLFVNKETMDISQGQLIDKVVTEVEKGLKNAKGMSNILLTAPTGSGKSLLFQLPAIYLGRKYHGLTIVVSPLKALIADQVESLAQAGYDGAAFASSDLTPEEKNEVYRRVREGEVDLFYLSPELLLSYDIKFFIGERRVNMIVVDEAHTVTTWGKEFRVDYWFMGRYLRKIKKYLGYEFPIFALTATAIWNPGGKNDMVFETIRSLYMDPCLLYIGLVKRKNIKFDIKTYELGDETYDVVKQKIVAKRIEGFLEGHKTIVYYPYAGTIDLKIRTWSQPSNWKYIASYYGKKNKEQKLQLLDEFKSGDKKIIVATKAFGMGIDISDIDCIYHVAPSGTFADYIQEIGRAARDESIEGIASTDFNDNDFYFMKRLHMFGKITQEQILLVLTRIKELYEMKGCKRNMTVSLSDFESVIKLPKKGSKMEYESDLEQQLKTALLWIEEDLHQSFSSLPLLVRPCHLITEGYLRDKTGTDAFYKQYQKYLVGVEGEKGIYKAQLDRLWEECFSDYAYPAFKRELYNGKLFGENFRVTAVGRHDVLLKEDGKVIYQKVNQMFTVLKRFLYGKMVMDKGHFMGAELLSHLDANCGLNIESIKRFLWYLFESRVEEGRSISYIKKAKRVSGTEEKFTITRGFDIILTRYLKSINERLGSATSGTMLHIYCTPFSDVNMLFNLLSMLKLIELSVEGGCMPSIFVRVNEPQVLNTLLASGTYHNQVYDNNEQIFQEQIELFTAFFGAKDLSNEERWNFVEDYFTGKNINELKEKYKIVAVTRNDQG